MNKSSNSITLTWGHTTNGTRRIEPGCYTFTAVGPKYFEKFNSYTIAVRGSSIFPLSSQIFIRAPWQLWFAPPPLLLVFSDEPLYFFPTCSHQILSFYINRQIISLNQKNAPLTRDGFPTGIFILSILLAFALDFLKLRRKTKRYTFLLFRPNVLLRVLVPHGLCDLNMDEAAFVVRRRKTYNVTINGFVEDTRISQYVI